MKTITLISDTQIVQKIFYLLSIKLKFKLNITTNFDDNFTSDILIVDEHFINDKFNFLKRYTKKLGAISSIELGFNKAKDFTINKPFLPSELEEVLVQNFNILDNPHKFTYDPHSIKFDQTFESSPKPFVNFELKQSNDDLEQIADDIANDIEDLNDDSIVRFKSPKTDGILDKTELAKIKKILENQEKPKEELEAIIDEALEDTSEIYEISEIIDKTIDELQEKAQKQRSVKVSLNVKELEELKPLLGKLDKNVLEELSNGANLEIHLKAGETK